MKKIFLIGIVAGTMSVAGLAFAQTSSTTPPILSFPIPELGNCASRQECKVYCDDPAHKEVCLAYAESRGLMKKNQVAAARALIQKTGPGGCTSKEACRLYCADTTHREECYAFAVRHGLRSQEESQKDKSFQSALKTTGGPGGCTQTASCKEYCADPTHATECRAFAEMHGFMRLRSTLSSTSPARIGTTTPMRPSTTTPRIGPQKMRQELGSSTKPLPPRGATSTRAFPPGVNSNVPPPPPPPTTSVPRQSLTASVINFLGSVFGW